MSLEIKTKEKEALYEVIIKHSGKVMGSVVVNAVGKNDAAKKVAESIKIDVTKYYGNG